MCGRRSSCRCHGAGQQLLVLAHGHVRVLLLVLPRDGHSLASLGVVGRAAVLLAAAAARARGAGLLALGAHCGDDRDGRGTARQRARLRPCGRLLADGGCRRRAQGDVVRGLAAVEAPVHLGPRPVRLDLCEEPAREGEERVCVRRGDPPLLRLLLEYAHALADDDLEEERVLAVVKAASVQLLEQSQVALRREEHLVQAVPQRGETVQ
mmetsp:Transcript_18578/g.53713  ORF Transcript_18578/g.53713 Transcript_18578/m.53713 type:complete len:209 (-) Transcript_18578:345-971(-)